MPLQEQWRLYNSSITIFKRSFSVTQSSFLLLLLSILYIYFIIFKKANFNTFLTELDTMRDLNNANPGVKGLPTPGIKPWTTKLSASWHSYELQQPFTLNLSLGPFGQF